MSLLESLSQKEGWLSRRLNAWQEQLAPIRTVTERWSYRDKLCLATAWGDEGWQFGMISRQVLIPIPRCPVHSQRARDMVELLGSVLPPGPSFPMAFYVQAGAQATLILKTAQLPDTDWLDRDLEQQLATIGIQGLWLHLHPAAGRRLFTKKGWRLLWGEPLSQDDNGLCYGPAAFQQLIFSLYTQALEEAEGFLAPQEKDSVVDLYCGTGASLVRWSRRGAHTIGVELGGEAVACAQQNAGQALVLRGKCEQRIPQLRDWLGRHAVSGAQALLYANPPRTGLEPGVLTWIADDFRPQRIAYLSCSAGTLHRDLNVLDKTGYRVERITPYDFFPQTHHVETLALLSKSMTL